MTTSAATKPTCFIAMPMTTHPHEADRYNDGEHWLHVMRTLFVPGIEAAGFQPIEPTAQGSDMIHGRIMEQLSNADMVLCDLSSHNPNVFFELGVRTSLNKPIALVRDEHTTIPFDTNGLNTHPYRSTMRGWELDSEIAAVAKHIRAAEESCAGENPMWRRFGLTLSAEQPPRMQSSTDARLEIIMDQLNEMRAMPVADGSLHDARSSSRAGHNFSSSERQMVDLIAESLDSWTSWHEYTPDGFHARFHLRGPNVVNPEMLAEASAIARRMGWDAVMTMRGGGIDIEFTELK